MWADPLESLFELEPRWKLHWGQKFWEVFRWEVMRNSEIRER